MRGPDFLVAGAARCGTTLLCSILGRHPDVHLADPKEPHFLAYGGAAASFTGPGDAQTINARAVLDESEWLRLFASDRPVTGEGSVTTLYEYERAIPAIGRHCPEAKVIIVLREPVARAHSAHGYMRARGYETVDFRTALEAEAERRANGWQHIWHYAAESRFTDQVRAFTESFEPDQLHFLYYENLQADPETELGRLHAFLDLPETDNTMTLGPQVNRSGEPRSRMVSGLARRLGDSPIRRVVRRATSYEARERVRRRLVRSQEIDPADRAFAREIIGPVKDLPVVPSMPSWASSDDGTQAKLE